MVDMDIEEDMYMKTEVVKSGNKDEEERSLADHGREKDHRKRPTPHRQGSWAAMKIAH